MAAPASRKWRVPCDADIFNRWLTSAHAVSFPTFKHEFTARIRAEAERVSAETIAAIRSIEAQLALASGAKAVALLDQKARLNVVLRAL